MAQKEQMQVINGIVRKYHWVDERVKALEECGYTVTSEWVPSGGIGSVRTIRKGECVQVSGARGGNNYVGKAYVAWFN